MPLALHRQQQQQRTTEAIEDQPNWLCRPLQTPIGPPCKRSRLFVEQTHMYVWCIVLVQRGERVQTRRKSKVSSRRRTHSNGDYPSSRLEGKYNGVSVCGEAGHFLVNVRSSITWLISAVAMMSWGLASHVTFKNSVSSRMGFRFG